MNNASDGLLFYTTIDIALRILDLENFGMFNTEPFKPPVIVSTYTILKIFINFVRICKISPQLTEFVL